MANRKYGSHDRRQIVSKASDPGSRKMNELPPHRVLCGSTLYRFEDRSLHIGHSSGFFSNVTVTLLALCDLLNDGLEVEQIHYRYSFATYRGAEQPIYDHDLYPEYFALNRSMRLPDPLPRRFVDHHGLYDELDYKCLNMLVRRYFTPSPRINDIVSGWETKYGFDGSKTIGVCYRGTDKQREVTLAQPSAFLEATRRIVQSHPECRVLIQTDQLQVRDLFLREFGDCCWYLEEMPVTGGGFALQHLSSSERGVDRFIFGQRIVATALMLSKCAHLVNHTGNMGFWIALLRGHYGSAIQFGPGGRILTPVRRRWHNARNEFLRYVNYYSRPANVIDKMRRMLVGLFRGT